MPSSSPSSSPSASPTPFDWKQIGSDIDGEVTSDAAGWSLSLSKDGTIVAVGHPNNNQNTGRTRIFRWDDTKWNQLGSGIDGEVIGNQAGYSVSLSDDGTTVAVGGPYGIGNDSGRTRIYRWGGTDWVQLGSGIDGNLWGENSGYSISLSDDGDTIAVGSPGYNFGLTQIGRVRIFRWGGTSWDKLGSDIDGEAAEDAAGQSVSLSGSGNTVAVGGTGGNQYTGRVRIFRWDGTSWNKLGSNIDGDAAGDGGGHSVSLSDDGNTVAVGSPYNSQDTGRVRIFKLNGTNWAQLGSSIDGEATGDWAGFSVSLSDDGNTVAVASPFNNLSTGRTRIFRWSGTSWNQLGSSIDGKAYNIAAGYSVSLSDDGTTVAVGAPYDSGTGKARIFS